MKKHEDGSVTFTKKEMKEVNKAYRGLYDVLGSFPTFIGDYFKEYADYLNMEKWHMQLNGETFRKEDFE